jgi:hypothetical protein
VTWPAKKPGAAAGSGAVVVVLVLVLVATGGGAVVVGARAGAIEDGEVLVVPLVTVVVADDAPGDAGPPPWTIRALSREWLGAGFREWTATTAAATAPTVRSAQSVNGTIRADFRVGVAPDAMALIVASQALGRFVTPDLKD